MEPDNAKGAPWPFPPLPQDADDSSPRPGGTATEMHKKDKETSVPRGDPAAPAKEVHIRPQAT